MNRDALYRLMAWLSPAYPVGAYSYSHGLEFAVEDGIVTGRESLQGWIESLLRHGAGQVDGAIFAAGWHAAKAGDKARLAEIASLAHAFKGSAETAVEAHQQGAAFASATRAAWASPSLAALLDALPADTPPPYALAVAIAAADAAIPLTPALDAYLQAFAANLVSAGVRLIPLGQTDGQIVTAALAPAVTAASETARHTPPDQIGTATPVIDWASMRHETQRTRLFRS